MPLPNFEFAVDGLGTFVARHETMGDRIAISNAADNLLDGHTENKNFYGWAIMISSIERLVVTYPPTWNIQELDPDAAGALTQVQTIHDAMRAAGKKNRAGGSQPGVQNGQGAVADS